MKQNEITKQACAGCSTDLQFVGTETIDEVKYDNYVCPGCGLLKNVESLTPYSEWNEEEEEFDDDDLEEEEEELSDDGSAILFEDPCENCMAGSMCSDCCTHCEAKDEHNEQVKKWIEKNPEAYKAFLDDVDFDDTPHLEVV